MKTTQVIATAVLAFSASSVLGASNESNANSELEAKLTERQSILFTELDANADGLINMEEAAQHPLLSEQFQILDADASGTLQVAEFRHFKVGDTQAEDDASSAQ